MHHAIMKNAVLMDPGVFLSPSSLLNNNNLHTTLFPEDEHIQSDNYIPYICENLKEEMVNKCLHLWV